MYKQLGLDEYELRARLAPVIVSVLGPIVAAVLLLPAPGSEWPSIILGLAGLAFAKMMTHTVRDRARELEKRLFVQWGGKPSTAMLRHADSRLPELVKQRYRDQLSEHMPDVRWPTREEEDASPELADQVYEAASRWLLEQTRDLERFRLLFVENINYGFRRNLLAARPFGIVIDVLGLIAVSLVAFLQPVGEAESQFLRMNSWTWIAGLFIGAHLAWLVYVVRPVWVRRMAERYAEQLLAASDTIR